MRVVFVAAVLLTFAPRAEAYTCEQVRAWHKQYGTAQLLRWAKVYRVSAQQRQAAIRCIWGRS